MAFDWVLGEVEGEITDDGRIIAKVLGCRGMDTPRPRERFEDSLADREVFERLWRYQKTGEFEPGQFETLGYMGGATALLVKTASLELLPEALMAKLVLKYGPLAEDMYLCEVRNTGAPTIWNVAEPSGGMAEDFNLPAEQIGETVELGFYREDGWLRFLLPEELSEHQERLDQEQSLWWQVVRPGFACRYEALISFLNIGKDTLDGRKGIIVAGPVGDFTHLAIAEINLPGTGWRVLDTECRSEHHRQYDESGRALSGWGYIALKRKIVGITLREEKSPMMYEFAQEGGLDPCGLHMALSGEAIENNISHLSRAILGPRGLNWLREEK